MTSGPRAGVPERGIWIAAAGERHDLAVFADRAQRLDAAAVIRLRTRADDLIGAWVATGFDALAVRVVAGRVRPPDVTCSADRLVSGLRAADDTGFYDFGYSMDSAWRTALPPESGFVHVDDVPEAVLADLARSGAELAREHEGPQGPPASLLDQDVLEVSGAGIEVSVPMRVLLALAAMRFMSDAEDGVVRVRALPGWLRLDARYGSVFRRRGDPVLLLS
jgi:hypothetical protein